MTRCYGRPDTLRQRFGLTERDDATGLDHTWFRKHENQAGRWTSPDPYKGSMQLGDPQSFNRYSYVENDPVNWVDPNGLQIAGPNTYYGPIVQGYGAFNGGLAGLVYFMAQAQHAYEKAIINNLSQVLSEIPFPIYYSQLGEFLFTFFSLQVNVTTSTITFVSGEPRLYPFDSPDGPAIDPPQQGGEVIFGGYNGDRVVPSRISQTARAAWRLRLRRLGFNLTEGIILVRTAFSKLPLQEPAQIQRRINSKARNGPAQQLQLERQRVL